MPTLNHRCIQRGSIQVQLLWSTSKAFWAVATTVERFQFFQQPCGHDRRVSGCGTQETRTFLFYTILNYRAYKNVPEGANSALFCLSLGDEISWTGSQSLSSEVLESNGCSNVTNYLHLSTKKAFPKTSKLTEPVLFCDQMYKNVGNGICWNKVNWSHKAAKVFIEHQKLFPYEWTNYHSVSN